LDYRVRSSDFRGGLDDLMRNKGLAIGLLLISVVSVLALTGRREVHGDQAAEAAPPADIVPGVDLSLLTVDHPGQYPLAAAVARAAASELVVTGTVSPDIARNVPVIVLASGRVVGIYARPGDTVQKGRLLLRVRQTVTNGLEETLDVVHSSHIPALLFDLFHPAQLAQGGVTGFLRRHFFSDLLLNQPFQVEAEFVGNLLLDTALLKERPKSKRKFVNPAHKQSHQFSVVSSQFSVAIDFFFSQLTIEG